MSLAAPLLAASWSWTTGEIALALAAVAGAVASRRSLRTRFIEDAGRAAWTEETLRDRAALRRLGKPVGSAALLGLALGFVRAHYTVSASTLAFEVGIVVALAGLVVAAALERATRHRLPSAPGSEAAAASVANDGTRSALLAVSGLQALASALVAATFADPDAAWGLAAGALVVAWFAHFARAPSPAAARLAGLMSVQAFALAAASRSAPAEVASLARLLVACGAALPWAVRVRGTDGLELGAGRRLLVPVAALALAGVLLTLFVPRGASSLALLSGVALAAAAARAGAWRGRPQRASLELSPALFLPLLALAATLVVATAAGGATGIALATAAAAALLPAVTIEGFAADLAAPAAPVAGASASSTGSPSAALDGARAASSTVVVLAGWAALHGMTVPLDLRDPATAGGATVGILLVLIAARLGRAAPEEESSRSTDAPPRAMIGTAVLAAAVPWCAARLHAAAGGGIAAGVLLGGGSAALLAPLAAAAPLERIVQLTVVALAFVPK
jgi:hypothetical protein